MAHEKKIMKEVSVFTVSRYLSYFFTVLSGFFIAKYLGPAAFGVFSALMLVVMYSQHAHLGLLSAMTKKVPFYRGKKRYDLAEETKNVTFTGAMLIVSVISVFLIVISFFVKNVSGDTVNSLRIVALIVIAQQFFYFYQTHLMVEKRFFVLGKMLLVYSATYLIFVTGLIMKFKLEGVFFASLFAYCVALVYVIRKEKFRFQLTMQPKTMLRLMKFGFPLLTMGIVSVFVVSIDKIMIIKFIDKLQLGYYSIATMIMEMIYFVPGAVGYVLFPRILEKYGKREETQYIRNHLFQPTIILSYLMPILIGLVFITAPPAIYYLLPNYVPGLSAVKILTCAGFFMSVMIVADNFLITLNKEKKILSIQAFSIVVAVSLNYLFISKGYGINGVAIATAITCLFYSTCVFVYSFKYYFHKISELLIFFAKIYSPFIYVTVILALLNLIKIRGDVMWDLLMTFLKLGLFTMLSLPLVWLVNKETGAVKLAFEMSTFKFKKKSYKG